MATYAEFCSHYGLSQSDPSSRTDYQRHKEEYALLRSLAGGES